MKISEIEKRLKSAMDNTHIDMLDELKSTDVEKMTEHDHITRQKDSKKNNKSKNIGNQLYKYGAFAAMFLILFVGGYSYNNLLTYDLYLDVNPSFNVQVNRKDKVRNIEALNLDAVYVLEDLDYKNKDYKDVMPSLVGHAKSKGYIEEEIDFVLVSSDTNAEEMRNIASREIEKQDQEIIVLNQRVDTNKDLASGLDALIQKISQYENIPDDEKLYDLTLNELILYMQLRDIEIEKYVNYDRPIPKLVINMVEDEEVQEEEVYENENTEEILAPPTDNQGGQDDGSQQPLPAEPAPQPSPKPQPQPSPQPYYEDDDDDDDWEDDDDDDDYGDDDDD